MFQVVLPVQRHPGGRAAVMRSLQEAGIGSGVHYPAVHRFTYYRGLGWRDVMLPQAERIGSAILTLPLWPSLRESDVERICNTLAEACKRCLR
jgi:dTDP-4-amino-4,6-dideoxygalactose transaminase